MLLSLRWWSWCSAAIGHKSNLLRPVWDVTWKHRAILLELWNSFSQWQLYTWFVCDSLWDQKRPPPCFSFGVSPRRTLFFPGALAPTRQSEMFFVLSSNVTKICGVCLSFALICTPTRCTHTPTPATIVIPLHGGPWTWGSLAYELWNTICMSHFLCCYT